jgi:peptidoglycan/LPS O-acetylase OafA/YrhL
MQARFGDGLNQDIQILRAFSVLIILAGHNYLRFIYQPLMFGLTYVSTWVGVDVFFAISGYVITLSLLKASHISSCNSTKGRLLNIYLFWIRRIFRIWPACWFWAIAVVFFQIVFDVNNDPISGRS